METYQVINELAKLKQKEDYEGFKNLFESLNLNELTKLHMFSIELKNSCEQYALRAKYVIPL